MRFGLAARFLLAGAVVVLFLVVELFVVLHSLNAVRAATRSQERAGNASTLASRIEKLVLDLETGSRGFVITRDPAFLQPWSAARRELPSVSNQLLALAPG